MSVCLLLIRVYVFAHVSQLNEYLPTEPFAGGKKKNLTLTVTSRSWNHHSFMSGRKCAH